LEVESTSVITARRLHLKSVPLLTAGMTARLRRRPGVGPRSVALFSKLGFSKLR